jgi:hypothetical protein
MIFSPGRRRRSIKIDTELVEASHAISPSSPSSFSTWMFQLGRNKDFQISPVAKRDTNIGATATTHQDEGKKRILFPQLLFPSSPKSPSSFSSWGRFTRKNNQKQTEVIMI